MAGEFYNAARNSESRYEISRDSKVLRVLGKGVDRIERISLADLEAYRNGSNTLDYLQGWQKSCILAISLTQYPTKETVTEALWRTLCWNIASRRYPAPSETGDDFEKWYRILISHKDLKTKAAEMGRVRNTFLAVYAPLCITSNGVLTAVTYTTEIGDCIAVLAGGRGPFVIRRTGGYYRLISPCYVHGIMNGEAFPEEHSELEWFSIR
jgi:hypothetical protein